jgi:hypothetical protein
MVTKIVFTTVSPDFLDQYGLEILETFDFGDRQAAKVQVPSDPDTEAVLQSVQRDDRVEGIEDSFDARLS